MKSTVALERYLAPLQQYLDMPGMTDLFINREKEVFVFFPGDRKVFADAALDHARLLKLAELITTYCNQQLSQANPIVGGRLPNGLRVQIVIPPACADGQIGFAFRRPATVVRTLDELARGGAYDRVWDKRVATAEHANEELCGLYRKRDIVGFIRLAIASGVNMLLSGATGSGKTTQLNSFLDAVPINERILTIEDTREMASRHPNQLNLMVYHEKVQGPDGQEMVREISAKDQLKNSLRLKPDRIFLGEIRDGYSAQEFMNAMNTGHGGSMATIHSHSPSECYWRMADLLKDVPTNAERPFEDLIRRVKAMIPLVLQFQEDKETGARQAVDIYFRDVDEPDFFGAH